jgi:nucleotidyltransferase substrate binding protein (TIGR01987 family)
MKPTLRSCEEYLSQFSQALEDLNAYANRSSKNSLDERQARDLIKSFEDTHELALKVISTYLEQMGKGPFTGSRDATVEAFHAELIDDGKTWLDMIIDRIQYNSIYPLDTQQTILENIKQRYVRIFGRFEVAMGKRLDEQS